MGKEVFTEGNLDLLNGKVAVIGYGSQGHAHALNLLRLGHPSVEVGLREGSKSWAKAEEAGLTVKTVPPTTRSRGAQLGREILLPDQVQPQGSFEQDIEPNLAPGASGAVRARLQHPLRPHPPRRPATTCIMVAPKGPGHVVRRIYTEGFGTPALIAVSRDDSGWPASSRSRMRSGSARAARESSRPTSQRRPNRTSSASRPCSAAASRS